MGREEVRATLSLREEVGDQDESNHGLSKIIEGRSIPVRPSPFPDLTITDLFISPQKRLMVTLSHLGDDPFIPKDGVLRIFFAGRLKESYLLSILSDQTHLSPRESISLALPIDLIIQPP